MFIERRVAKESAFDRQLRLAMEQSLREATANQKVEEPKQNSVEESVKMSKVTPEKLSVEKLPQSDWNIKESETEVQRKISETVKAADYQEGSNEIAADSKVPDEIKPTNNADIIDLISPKEKITESAEKPKKPKKQKKALESSGWCN